MKLIDLQQFKRDFNLYTELRAQRNRQMVIQIINGDVLANYNSEKVGYSSRVFHEGSWGLASQSHFSKDAIKGMIKKAEVNAKFFSKYQKPFNLLPSTATGSYDFSTDKNRWSHQSIMDFMKEISNLITKKYPKINSHTAFLSSLDMEKKLITSENSDAFSLTPRTFIYLSLDMKNDKSESVNVGDIWGGFGQFEDNFHCISQFEEKLEKIYEHLVNKTNAVFANAGTQEVVLDSDLAGILAHEAVGHTTEADLVLGGSVAADYLGKEAASELVTLTDYAHHYEGKLCPVPVHIDDEGTASNDTVIIEDGILKSFMHTKETAAKMNHQLTGNARAYEFSDEPLVRMRNTAINPGTSKLDEMISSIKDGYYLIKASNGQADSTGEFMFGVPLGYEIKNGKIGRAIKETTISGVAFDLLKTVTMISDEMTWGCAGMCGKKQMIPVGMGGPAIKCKVNMGGK